MITKLKKSKKFSMIEEFRFVYWIHYLRYFLWKSEA